MLFCQDMFRRQFPFSVSWISPDPPHLWWQRACRSRRGWTSGLISSSPNIRLQFAILNLVYRTSYWNWLGHWIKSKSFVVKNVSSRKTLSFLCVIVGGLAAMTLCFLETGCGERVRSTCLLSIGLATNQMDAETVIVQRCIPGENWMIKNVQKQQLTMAWHLFVK